MALVELVWDTEATDSLNQALDEFCRLSNGNVSKKQDKLQDFIEKIIEMFEEGGPSRMSSGFLRDEAEIKNGIKFWALKPKKVRIYFWYSKKDPGKAIVSHCVYKTWAKLRDEDTARVQSRYEAYEGK